MNDLMGRASGITQRWRAGRSSYRPAGETIRTADYEVSAIASDRTARAFVREHHYSGSMGPARRRFGIFRGGVLEGVAVFGVPQNYATYRGLPGTPQESLDLSRFVLLDQVPSNGETWFLGRCFELLRREGFVTVVSFSDPAPRATADGREVFPGHIGTIYQAHNASYLGRSKAERKWVLPDGRVIPNRSVTKIRKRDRGAAGAVATLVDAGATDLRVGDDAKEWVERWLPRVCRPLRHPGNHKYAWSLDRRSRRMLPPSLPYPKLSVCG